jgi:hypothetical protein
VWIWIVITILLSFIINKWLMDLTEWWLYPGWFPLPYMLYIILFNLVLGRFSSKFQLTKQEMVCIMAASHLAAGCIYLQTGRIFWNIASTPTYSQYMPIYAIMTEPMATEWASAIPDFWVPKDMVILNDIWYGSGVVNWGPWMVPIAYWASFFVLWAYGGFLWGFFLRKPQVVEERLPYPMFISGAYIANWLDKSPRGISQLFDLSITRIKLFWLAFGAGTLFIISDVLAFLIPTIPPSAEWGAWTVDLNTVYQQILPGAYGTNNIGIMTVFLGGIHFLCTMEVLATMTIFAFVIPVLYQALIVRMGIVPYTPGWEGGSQYAWEYGPFRYTAFAVWGLIAGIGIWMIFANRNHFAQIFKVAFGLTTEGPTEEEGISYRFVGLGAIILTLGFIAFYIATGLPVTVSIWLVGAWIVVMFGNTRLIADLFDSVCYGFWYGAAWDVGYASGAYGMYPSTDVTNVRTQFMVHAIGDWGPRMSSFSMTYSHGLWKVAYETKTRAKDIMLVFLVSVILAAVVGHTWSIYWVQIMGGFTNVGPIGYYEWAVDWTQEFTLVPPVGIHGDTMGRWTYIVAGVATVFVIQLLRMRFPWFFINPSALVVGWLFPWMWLGYVVPFIAKFLILRIGGAKLYSNVGVPIVIGGVVGYGVAKFLVDLIVFWTRAVPTAMARL